MRHHADVYSIECGIDEYELRLKQGALHTSRDSAARYRWRPRAASAVNAGRRRVLQSSESSR